MSLFLLLWLISIAIVFSIEIVLGVFWSKYTVDRLNSQIDETTPENAIKSYSFIKESYNNYLNLYFWWFLIILSFFFGIFLGWFVEKQFKLLFKLNINWQKLQPNFYKRTRGEYRIFLPWILFELPIVLSSLALLFFYLFNNIQYKYQIISLIIFIIGFSIGQLIEITKDYKIIILMDRPEKPPTSILQKIKPSFPSKHSLLMGQMYCRIFVPYFFIYIAVLIPSKLLIIPNLNDKTLIIIALNIFLGVMIRWFYDKNDSFYFGKITLSNFLFITFKITSLLLILFPIIAITNKIIFIILCSILCGFIIPWHPEKLRQ